MAEDSEECTDGITELLRRISKQAAGEGRRLRFAHLAAPMPQRYRSRFYQPRGVSGRNAALQFVLERTREGDEDGVIFFGDDDNAYHGDLFSELAGMTGDLGLMPVGMVLKQVGKMTNNFCTEL